MCKCNPMIRTLYCGKGDCKWPEEEKENTLKDQFALFYIKEGILYPVALTEEQNTMFRLLIRAIPGKIAIIQNLPQGEVKNLKRGIKRDG